MTLAKLSGKLPENREGVTALAHAIAGGAVDVPRVGGRIMVVAELVVDDVLHSEARDDLVLLSIGMVEPISPDRSAEVRSFLEAAFIERTGADTLPVYGESLQDLHRAIRDTAEDLGMNDADLDADIERYFAPGTTLMGLGAQQAREYRAYLEEKTEGDAGDDERPVDTVDLPDVGDEPTGAEPEPVGAGS